MRTLSIGRHLARLAAVTVFSFACAGPVLADAPEPTRSSRRSPPASSTSTASIRRSGPRQLGDHRRDGEIDDVSAAGRERGLAWTRGLQAELAKIPRERLSRENQIDAAVLDNQLRYSVWSVEKYRDWSWDPLIYTGVAGDALYSLLARDYAPLPQRLRAVTLRLEALPRLFEQTRANLVPARVPAINAETAVKQNPGVTQPDRRADRSEPVGPLGRRPRATRARDRGRADGRRRAAEVARDGTRAEREGRVPDRRRALRREARVRADVAALAPGDPRARRQGSRRDPRADVRGCTHRARESTRRTRRAGDADRRPAAGRDRCGARARLRRSDRARGEVVDTREAHARRGHRLRPQRVDS